MNLKNNFNYKMENRVFRKKFSTTIDAPSSSISTINYKKPKNLEDALSEMK